MAMTKVPGGMIDSSGDITITNLTVTGDLSVTGTTTSLETATLNVEDKNIVLNYGSGDTSASADGAGITIQDAIDAAADATFMQLRSAAPARGPRNPTARQNVDSGLRRPRGAARGCPTRG